jgi:type VI secretion system secreted protein VgrG
MKLLPCVAVAAFLLLGADAQAADPQTTRQIESLQQQVAALQTELAALRRIVVGRRVVLEAGDELILRVGQASILLRKDGAVTVKGVSVTIEGAANVAIKGPKVLNN